MGSNSTHTMASAGARAYNGGLGSPQRGPGGRAPGGGGKGRSPPAPAADEVLFKTVIFNAYATVLHEMMYCVSCFFCKVSK